MAGPSCRTGTEGRTYLDLYSININLQLYLHEYQREPYLLWLFAVHQRGYELWMSKRTVSDLFGRGTSDMTDN